MEIAKSRNGFYTVTFYNRNNLSEKEILDEFSTVGNVCKIINNFQRVFIRFKDKEEAQRAIEVFGEKYRVDIAKNKESSFSDFQSSGSSGDPVPTSGRSPLLPLPTNLPSDMAQGRPNPDKKYYHLILGNLPRNYTIRDINALVEEVNPLCINNLEDTRVFKLKFCHVVLESKENLHYLIEKLNNFMIWGERLIAAEIKNIVEWRQNVALATREPSAVGSLLLLLVTCVRQPMVCSRMDEPVFGERLESAPSQVKGRKCTKNVDENSPTQGEELSATRNRDEPN